ncbi:MAG: 16S rRNA processing protein RimM [Epsilonproteobacteria bacterium]|nr:16S rRNA processing protein RimM [Campylobacterota bacterium]
MNDKNELIQVAKIGRLVGLKGELKLNIKCDFPEQFRTNASFLTDKDTKLTIHSFNITKKTISFKGYASREDAAKLVNLNLFITKQDSLEECKLEDGEFFWFEMIDSILMESNKKLGKVQEIQRIGATDYLIIKTDEKLVEKDFPKLFYVPYIDRYIRDFDKKEKIIYSIDTFGILENS